MKKLFIAALLAAFAAVSLVGQEGGADVRLLDAGNYSKLFLNTGGNVAPKYADKASDDDYSRISALGGKYLDDIDTPLEIALLSTCAGVIDIRPAEADAILPKSNPKLTDTKLGAAAYLEMQAATGRPTRRRCGSSPAGAG